MIEDKVFSSRRDDFPMLKKRMHGHPLIYFDTAATAQKPLCVIEAEADFYRHHYGTVHRAIYELALYSTQHFQQAREGVQAFLGAAKPEEIIFTRGTTESINLVATCFGKAFVMPGDEIILSEIEHHSNIVPWQMMAEERRAIIKIIPVKDSGELDLESYSRLLSSKTKIVSIAHIANSIGTLNPIEKIGKMAHAYGAKLFVDGAQAAPHMPIDVQKLDADFYVFSGHKAYGPTGVGVLYGKEDLLEQMPPYQGGGDMIERVTFEKTTYNRLPLKFEAGTPMIAQVESLSVALRYLEEIGLKKIEAHEQALLSYMLERLKFLSKVRLYGTSPDKGAIVSFSVEGLHPLDIGTLLDLKGIAVRTGHHCAQPAMRRFGVGAMVRASFGLYNTFEEIDLFISSLQEIIKKLS